LPIIRAAWNNLAYAAGTIVPSLVLALLFALALREATRLNAILRMLIVMPLLIPLVAAAASFPFILLPGEGLLDFYLARFGLGMVNWLGDPDLALGSMMAITVWKNTGYCMHPRRRSSPHRAGPAARPRVPPPAAPSWRRNANSSGSNECRKSGSVEPSGIAAALRVG
jgi:hypothetical protein